MAQDQQDPPAADQPSPPTAAELDSEFAAADRSPGLRRVWQQAAPDLPPELAPYSFVSVALLGHLGDALALSPGTTLVDLGCGRGGPGLWLAQSPGAALIGVDFSAVAVQQATDRAALFRLATQARFLVGDLAGTGLADGVADAVVSIDALHFAADPTAAAREALRLLRPGGRLVLTNWQAHSPADPAPKARLCCWLELISGISELTEVACRRRSQGEGCSCVCRGPASEGSGCSELPIAVACCEAIARFGGQGSYRTDHFTCGG
jgi:SAM-dependent methyltransferase